MSVSRRRFLKLLAAAGVTLPAGHWLASQLEAYATERLAFQDVRGPGLETFTRTVCRDCANHCSLSIRKVDELPVGVRGTAWNPVSQGSLCSVGVSQMQALFDQDRLRSPLFREDAGEAGQQVEWLEATQILRDKIGPLIAAGAGDRIAVVDGRTPSLGTHLVQAWAQSIPGARYVPMRIETALDQIIRDFLGAEPGGRLQFDLARTGTLLCVGAEILEVDGSPVSQMREHAVRRESRLLAGAPTVFLGPRRGPTAVKADMWIECQPGQEREVLLAFAETLSKEHPNRSLVMAEYARWVPEARDEVEFSRRYSLENVTRRLGLRQDELEAVAVAMAEYGPSVAIPGPGILRQVNGAANARAALALNLWTDGLQANGGLSWQRDPLEEVSKRLGLRNLADQPPSNLIDILEPLLEIKRSPVDVLICIEANLVHELPGRDQIARALSHIPFVAYFSAQEDETSQLAHLTLPTLLSSESWDLPAPAWGVPEGALQVQMPAIVPVIEAPSVEDLLLSLAGSGVSAPGFDPPAEDSQALVAAAISTLVSLRRGNLVQDDSLLPLADVEPDEASRALLSCEAAWVDESVEATRASRRVGGQNDLPVPMQDLAPSQVWLVPFDAVAIQGGRVLNRPMMMELSGHWYGIAWESWIELNPADAERFGLSHGDRVRIRGPRAEIVCVAVVTGSVVPGMSAAPVGFGHQGRSRVASGHGANILELPNTRVDEDSGAPTWGPIPVFLSKA